MFDLTGIPGRRAEPCEPNVVIEGDLDLERYGVPGGVVIHTSGHTLGSVSTLLPSGDALAGDLVIGGISFLGGITRLGHAQKPPFEDDPIAVRQSLTELLDRGVSRFHVGHGGPLTATAVRRYMSREPRLAALENYLDARCMTPTCPKLKRRAECQAFARLVGVGDRRLGALCEVLSEA